MNVLVTGSAGFIGYHMVKYLLKRDWNVFGIDNLNDYYSVDLKRDRLKDCGIQVGSIEYNKRIKSSSNEYYSFCKLELEDLDNLLKLFDNEKFDYVINLAAQAGVRYSIENPKAYIKSNIDGFLNILEACKKYPPKKLLYASSSSVYGLNENQPFSIHDKVDSPVSMYAATKKCNELMAHVYSNLHDLNTVGLRFFTVYGPWGRPDMAPFLFGDAIVNDRPIKVFNYGDMKRDFTYVDDIVLGIHQVINTVFEKKYNIFNIGNGKPIDLSYFIECLEKELGRKAIKKMMKMQPGDVKTTWADTKELETLVGYKPNTQIEIGVKKFVEWYKNYY